MLAVRSFLATALVGCSPPPATTEPTKELAPFVEVVVDTAHGLSGLAADRDGGIWAVSERGERAYRIVLGADRPRIETFVVEAIPPRTDLEGIAWLGDRKFALGTEGRLDGGAKVLLAEQRGGSLVVTGEATLPDDALGVALRANNGAEGVCGAGDTIVTAIETAGTTDGGKRWGPVVIVSASKRAILRTHRVWLATATGKLSGLDCSVAADGTIHAIAIERHFEVTKILTFTLPPVGQGSDEVFPHVALDLGPVLKGRLNLEGIARLPDGRVVAAVDNQWKAITGPSTLVVFARGALR